MKRWIIAVAVICMASAAYAELRSITFSLTGISTNPVAAVTQSKTDVRGKVVSLSFSCTTNADWSLVTTADKGSSYGGAKEIMTAYTNTMAMNTNLSETIYLMKDTVTLSVGNALSTGNTATLRMVLEP